jgi:hypothetical protein
MYGSMLGVGTYHWTSFTHWLSAWLHFFFIFVLLETYHDEIWKDSARVNIVSNMLQTLVSVKTKPCKVRLEGGSIVSLYVHPLYGEPLKIIFHRCVFVSHKQFVEVYNVCNKGPSPKSLRWSKDFHEEEVQELFGPCVSKNGYWYCFNDNVDIIKSVEKVWMI